jgi:RNA polymerase sigma-70 factor (ECF subfamily)
MTTITIEQIYREFQKSILNFVYLRINNMEDAEDLTQKIFMKANRLLHTYNPETSAVSTWLYKITTTSIVDYFRTNHQDKYKAVSDFVNQDGDAAFQFESPAKADKLMEAEEIKNRLVKAFRKLKPDYRKVAIYYFFREYKYEEIAEQFDMKLGTVKAMISRCREMLKSELRDLYATNVLMEKV